MIPGQQPLAVLFGFRGPFNLWLIHLFQHCLQVRAEVKAPLSVHEMLSRKKKKKAHVQELKGHMVSLGLYNLSGASPFASRPWGLQGIGQLQLYLSI